MRWRRQSERGRDLERGVRDHLDLEAAKRRKDCPSMDGARYAAQRAVGNTALAKEDMREAWGWTWLDRLGQDLRLSLRMLRQSPGFTTVVVVALMIGIGGNTALFTVVNTVLLRPLPYRDSEGLVAIFGTRPGMAQMPFSVPDFLDYRAETKSLTEVFSFNPFSSNVTAAANAERVIGVQASANFFDVLGRRPLIGRSFVQGEDQAAAERVTVLSYGLWQRQFGGDPQAIGRSVLLNGQKAVVVGVMPADFVFPYGQRSGSVDLWTPLVFTPDDLANRGLRNLFLVGRMRRGFSLNSAQAEMHTIAMRLAHEYPITNANQDVQLIALHEQVVGRSRPALLILLGAAGLVLLIACANVANLLLARATVRQKELAVRSALGAGLGRLVRQLLTESLVLAGLAGVVGTLLAYCAVRMLRLVLPADIPRIAELGMDGRVLAFTLAASVLTGLLFGIVPALQLSRSGHEGFLLGAGRSVGGRGTSLAGRIFVSAEISLALVLAIGSGLLIQSFIRLQRVEIGFNPSSLMTFSIWPSGQTYHQPAQKVSYYEQVLAHIAALPGIQLVGAVAYPPLAGGCANGDAVIEGRPKDIGEVHSDFNVASSNYFLAIGVPLRMGRLFSERETAGSTPVTVISDAFARKVFPNEYPLGKRITFWGQTREVVGVVGDVRQIAAQEPLSTAYVPMAQYPWPYMTIVVRTNAANAVSDALRHAVREIDPGQPLYKLQSMTQTVSDGLAQPRFEMVLFGLFAGMALLLAAIGIYGLMAYWVAQRAPEIGIRMALGAQASEVLRLVLWQGLTLLLAGVAGGVIAALGLNRVLSSLLFGVATTDPATFAGTALLLMAVGLIAIWAPARKATRIDPLAALRNE